jgi:hypothetical protein
MKTERLFLFLQKAILEKYRHLSISNRYPSILRSKLHENLSRARAKSKVVTKYWSVYGGWSALFRSPFLWIAIAFSLITAPAWLEVDDKGIRVWSQLPLSIIPNILGFSMGGMAIMLSFTGSKVFKHITQDGQDDSYFLKVVAAFFHFITVQTLALFFGLFCRIYSFVAFSFIGYVVMCYALLIALATASQLFNTARVANIAASIEDSGTKD